MPAIAAPASVKAGVHYRPLCSTRTMEGTLPVYVGLFKVESVMLSSAQVGYRHSAPASANGTAITTSAATSNSKLSFCTMVLIAKACGSRDDNDRQDTRLY